MKPFVVRHGAIVLRVKLLPTVKDITALYKRGSKAKRSIGKGMLVFAFFEANISRAKYTGTLYFSENSRLFELVPHEVTHAVLHHFKQVSTDDDEKFAMAIGCLTARILTRLDGDQHDQ